LGDTVDDIALARGSARGRGERNIHAVATARGGPLWFTCDNDDDDDDGHVAACDTSYGENSSSNRNDAGRAGGDGKYGDHDNDDLILHEDIAGSCPDPDPDNGGDWGWFSQGGEDGGAVARCTTPERASDRTPRARSATPPSPTRVGHNPHPHSHQHQNEHQTEEAVEDKDESTEDDASMDNDARSISRHCRRRPSAWDAYSKSHKSGAADNENAADTADMADTDDTDVACSGNDGYLRLDFIGTQGDLVVRPHELIEFVMGGGGSLSAAVDFERRYSSPFAGRAESCVSSPYSPPSIGSSPRHTGTMGREAGSSFPYSFS
jgi:hypothetical protein